MEPINQKFSRRAWKRAALFLAVTACIPGCEPKPLPYGFERPILMPGVKRQVWAVAPVLNLSGEKMVDPILQADLLFEQLQQVQGLTVIPVNRTAEAMAALRLEKVQSVQQADALCELLGVDGLVVATVTLYDPYNPPKVGAALQLFRRSTPVVRQASGKLPTTNPAQPGILQVVGMYDAQNGTVRDAVLRFAKGRNDPQGPYAAKEYFVNMDRFGGFVYHVLIADLLNSPRLRRNTADTATEIQRPDPEPRNQSDRRSIHG